MWSRDYVTALTEAWELHKAKRQQGAPTVVSTFAGGGGSSLGYSMEGFQELVAVEIHPHAVLTLKNNFPGLTIYDGSIADYKGSALAGKVDVLDGSPPCQGFSMVGKRDISDPRNSLFKEYARLIDEIRPKVFVMENVSAMTKGRTAHFYLEAVKLFRSLGYKTQSAILNAKHYGVPQSRERLFVVGNLGNKKLNWPKPFPYVITAGEALAGLPPQIMPRLSDAHGRLWERIKPGKDAKSILKNKGWSSVIKLDPLRPSRTICKTGGTRGVATTCHWAEPRSLSIAEIKRLSSFPDEYQLEGPFLEQWARIGNCVPPFLIRALARNIRESLLN